MGLQARPLFSFPANIQVGQDAARTELVRTAEASGFDLFSLQDHPYNAGLIEAYAGTAFLLGATTTIGGYVGVTNLPLRPAPMLARTAAALTAQSDGRFALGLGSGGFWQHIPRMGVQQLTPKQAVDAFEEAIEVVRGLTGGPAAAMDFTGKHYRVGHLAPATVPTPPIWTGAGGPRTLAITGRLTDGWIPQQGADWLTSAYRDGRAHIDDAARAAGRDPADIITIFNFGGALTDRDLPSTRSDDGRWVGGSARQWVEALTSAVLEHGAGGFNTGITDASGALGTDLIRRFGAEVIAPVRVAVA
ncbi:LLM class flavin-dependent oxidoreductase [Flexivirga meconopsidis]|uniref:LLM class flavin-dependent oxidoreductase n=1 Tax=Flexivirga meconopsidis TaxID=2977121 RepID=UPI00223F8624|nr:LLM class flavin-dependent oxidoreductase [Flexivirga meconopsidis]